MKKKKTDNIETSETKVEDFVSNLKVQIIDPPIAQNVGDKMCFPTYHAWTNSQKASVLERVVSNPHLKFRINFTDESPKEGEWFEEIF